MSLDVHSLLQTSVLYQTRKEVGGAYLCRQIFINILVVGYKTVFWLKSAANRKWNSKIYPKQF